ncbi:twin-arginine translocase TatA/TatE family subunit [Symbiobacterium thermophilum]|jgi:sec-independent protein translocase protein TatA|uniref:Sec-independent protein translocase protein TatA n=2 Tax=Symbiobacterium thermophilum TaxID=2734 RepID=Q67LK4_SYMTH|nr:twin-arginine translocase TatA/TatE family subunit [Symbiobacterium thermophilum]MBY6276858.1 twin-arginine translocase TatA/TatE family subunit [Symbiobacterium thermophilum]BAD41442.1 putative Sec-independent protein translocase [Symbiobacterium thermophilum IAM 14863]
MFGRLGTMEILLIVLVILLLFGGAKLPQLARGLGDSIKEFRKAVKQDDDKNVSDKEKEQE